LGRLWDLPLVTLQPLQQSVEELRRAAPRWLRERAARPMSPAQQDVWQIIRHRDQLGTEAVAQVAVWIEDYELGYVLDFVLPEYGVNLQVSEWEPRYEQDELPEFDPAVTPDHPFNEERDDALRECLGIEVVSYWDTQVRELGPESVCDEIRKELGFGRPPWL